MAAMNNGSSKRGKLIDVVILSAVLIFIAAAVLVVVINWGTWGSRSGKLGLQNA